MSIIARMNANPHTPVHKLLTIDSVEGEVTQLVLQVMNSILIT